MTHPLSTLEPKAVWDNFYQLTQIPRPSKHEEAIQAFMLEFGRSLGLETFRDDVGNVIIKKPAHAGCEDCPGVILQSHLDMVPQANSDVDHDFTRDPIQAYIDGQWVTARGTTLGADNGIGVAAVMAVLADQTIKHGPIEALFTCDEETGMTGAFGLSDKSLSGEILLNLDSEDEKELYIGCAGGVDGIFQLPVAREAMDDAMALYQIQLRGLKGGHSGVDISCQRGNANKLLARFLTFIDSPAIKLCDFSGGNLRNAIPRESSAIIACEPKDIAAVRARLTEFMAMLHAEYAKVEPDIALTVVEYDGGETYTALNQASKQRFLAVMNAAPNGVYRMSLDMEGLVETSSNLAIVEMKQQAVHFDFLLRSSVDSARDELAQQISDLFLLAGGEGVYEGAYPGWQPNLDSRILAVMQKTGEALFGEPPALRSIHAGLECGLLGGIYPNWDMISFGPTIRFPHSPDEKVEIASVGSFYTWLVATLEAVPSLSAKA